MGLLMIPPWYGGQRMGQSAETPAFVVCLVRNASDFQLSLALKLVATLAGTELEKP